MAETKLTNAVIPEIFSAYTVEPSIYRSRLFNSGVIQLNPGMSNLLAGGGETFNLPFWQDVAGTSGDIPSESSEATVNNMAAVKQIFRRHTRLKAYGTNDLVKVFAGSNPLQSLQDMVNNYWAQAYEQVAIASMIGVFADNDANDSDDLIKDISGGTGDAAVFNSDAVIEAQGLLGENGTVGRPDLSGGDFVAIAVHPKVYELMRKQNAIDFIPIGDQTRPTAFYMGMEVIVSRNLPESGGVYTTYVLKNGALQYGISSNGYEATEVNRDPTKGFGIDALYTRRVFGIHPVGTAWQEDTIAGASPTDAELDNAVEWDRVFEAENMRMVAVKAKIA